jgi:GT2 family glycosyltransferase/glycosyltransferase involved in cell wall biosynthesis
MITTKTAVRVTIVVPIYGHIPSLERCIKSVLKNVDLALHRLLLINDCGPEADEIEHLVFELIEGHTGVQYERNRSNLGFVSTCNRAVEELDQSDNDILLLNSDAQLTPGALDELIRVLYINEKHGVAFPRSNNASISSVPVLPLGGERASVEDSKAIYSQLSSHMPPYTLTPVAVGFCFLVRRQLILNYGFFDEIYSPGYSEENDFCLRVNKYGYSSVMANHAYAVHEGSMSFVGVESNLLKQNNELRMLERYGFYHSAVVHYFQYSIDAADWFSDRIFGSGPQRVLIDLHHLSLIYNGSTRNALSFLELLAERRYETSAEFVIVSSAEAIDFFSLRSYGFTVLTNGEVEGSYDLGFALSPVSFSSQLFVLNRHCVRWVISHFDVIALRINSLLEGDYARRQVVLDSLRFANRVVPISHAALDDVEAFFGADLQNIRERSTVIHEGVAEGSFENRGNGEAQVTTRQAGYVLVIGNIFTHKQFPEAIDALRNLSLPVLAFGALANPGPLPRNVEFIQGGLLSDDEIDLLYRGAACVVFPSSYEGFGLPIAEAAQRGKPLVIFDTDVGREVVESLGIADRTRFFRLFSELPELVTLSIARSEHQIFPELRTLRAYNEGLLAVLLEELDRPVDIPALRLRTSTIRSPEIYKDATEARLRVTSSLLNNPSVKIALALSRRLGPLRPILRASYAFMTRMIRRRPQR